MVTMPIEVYSDGSSLKNPGMSGYAYVIRYWDTPNGSELPQASIIEESRGYRLSTNNRMEIMGAMNGLQHVLNMVKAEPQKFSGCGQVNLASDSEYVCNAINLHWIEKWQQNNWMTSGYQGRQPKDVKNKDLWEQLLSIIQQMKSNGLNVTFNHIKGHNGHEFNEQADKLAVAASNDLNNHLIDEVYEKTMPIYNRR